MKGIKITSNEINKKQYSITIVLNSNKLKKYKTTFCTTIKIVEQYLIIKGQLEKKDYHIFKIIPANDTACYFL